jgi:predicted lipoprotein with Yx(FWY)xxD motif
MLNSSLLTRWVIFGISATAALSACGKDNEGGIELPTDSDGEDAATAIPGPSDAGAVKPDAALPAPDSGVTTEPTTDDPEPLDASMGTGEFDASLVSLDAQVPDEPTVVPEPEDAATPISSDPPSVALDAGLGPSPFDAGFPLPEGADAGWPREFSCVYQSPPVPLSLAPDAGADAGDGGPPPGPHVILEDNPFLGQCLADHAGYSLYIYTADLPGDCESPPVSTCFEDCLLAWPLFEAGERLLGEGLDDAAFGSFVREDGARQTTYHGWPLYYYKKDTVPEEALGQSKGKVWFLAERVLPNLIQMRASEALGGIKYLADGRGRSLYAYDGDVQGTLTRPPRAVCSGDCLLEFAPFGVRALRPVTTLEPDELSVFVRDDGTQQVSFRGQPLYLFEGDARSGEMNGALMEGFRLIEL